jgi:hypothetical protein
VQVYRYLEEETSRFALTRDVGGATLPAIGAVWLYAGAEELEAYPAPVKAAILQKGYYLWPDDAGRGGFGSVRVESALD